MEAASRRRRTTARPSRSVRREANRSQQHCAHWQHMLDPDDPRLKLSLRAFYPMLNKKRRPRLSFSELASLTQPSQSPPFFAQSPHASQASQTPPPPMSSSSFLAYPPGLAQTADLYDPSSPWGVTGIQYDPCSPRPARNAAPPSLMYSPSDDGGFDSSPQSSPSPPPNHHVLPFYLALSSTDVQYAQDAANQGLATDIVMMLETKRTDVENSCELSLPTPRPTKATPKKAQPAKKTPVPAPVAAARCCPPQVPSIVHMLIDGSTSDVTRVKSSLSMLQQQFADTVHLLCVGHRERYLRMAMASGPAIRNEYAGAPAFTPPAARASHAQFPPCRSPPTLQPKPSTRALHSSLPATHLHTTPTEPTRTHAAPRPLPKAARDDIYRHEMLREIADRFRPLGNDDEDYTHGDVTNRVVYDLLNVAVHPQPVVNGRGDAHFLSGEEAYALLERCSPREPVVTQNEQSFRWRPNTRPIEELFRRMENLDRMVSVQVPSRPCTNDSFESRELTEVRARFLRTGAPAAGTNDDDDDEPWNILDLRSPLPAAVLPQFLTSENCQLLPRLRDEVLNPSRAERDTASREQWNEWRDVLEWVLLSEGGHNTSPHTDSHGLGTWITVQEGLFGFGWMSHPTPAERRQWMDDPHGFRGGRWCFMLLEPGQTVFFNSGTVHFVFRQRGQATLALGGHVLQWTGVEQWLSIVAAQLKNPHITNEDMEWSAPKYVHVVARLVEMRLQQHGHDEEQHGEVSRIAAMGGEAAVKRLLKMLQDFDDEHLRPRPRPRGKSRKKRR